MGCCQTNTQTNKLLWQKLHFSATTIGSWLLCALAMKQAVGFRFVCFGRENQTHNNCHLVTDNHFGVCEINPGASHFGGGVLQAHSSRSRDARDASAALPAVATRCIKGSLCFRTIHFTLSNKFHTRAHLLLSHRSSLTWTYYFESG